MNDTLTKFPIMRYRMTFTIDSAMRLPEYAGSVLRGAFGYALRQLTCMTKQPICQGCFLRPTCAYQQIFEPEAPIEHSLQKFSAIPVPIVIEPPSWGQRVLHPGDTLDFHIIVLGKALEQLPLIIMAWQRAFARGVGKERATARLKEVVTDVSCVADNQPTSAVIYTAEEGTILPHQRFIQWGSNAIEAAPQTVTLHIETPMLLQSEGRAVFIEELTPTIFVKALLRRINLLSEFYDSGMLISQQKVKNLIEYTQEMASEKKLHWFTWTRNSSRQKQLMHFSGTKGYWTITGDWSLIYRYLQLGQLTHVGKETVFGMGQYRIVNTT